MTDRVRLEIDGAVAIITNDNPEKHNAFDDEMDAELFAILAELGQRNDVRAVIWRARASRSRRAATSRRSARSRSSCRTTS